MQYETAGFYGMKKTQKVLNFSVFQLNRETFFITPSGCYLIVKKKKKWRGGGFQDQIQCVCMWRGEWEWNHYHFAIFTKNKLRHNGVQICDITKSLNAPDTQCNSCRSRVKFYFCDVVHNKLHCLTIPKNLVERNIGRKVAPCVQAFINIKLK